MFFLCFLLTFLATSDATFCQQSDDKTLHIRPSRRNCSNFIACINYEEYTFSCIEAPLFLPWTEESQACITPCPSVDVVTTKKTTAKTSTDLPPDPLLYPERPRRTVVCPPNGKTTAQILGSCTGYIECNDGIGTLVQCSDGDEFSAQKQECVSKEKSSCSKLKPKGLNHVKCRYDKGGDPIYFPSDDCNNFLKCANRLAWNVPCAKRCGWDEEHQTCQFDDLFECDVSHL